MENGPAEIAVKQAYTVDDFCEFTIQSVTFSYDVLPDVQSGVYTHYQAEDDKIYLYDKVVAINDNPGTENTKTILDNFDELFDLYFPPETTTEPQYTAPQKPPAYFEENIIGYTDVSEGKTVPEDFLTLTPDSEVIY